MKKLLIFSLMLAFVFGVFAVKNSVAQEDFQVSPRVWVLGTLAVEEITVHAAYPCSEVADIKLSVDESEIEEFSSFCDSRGEVVVKFSPDIADYVEGDEPVVSLQILDEFEAELFIGSYAVLVK